MNAIQVKLAARDKSLLAQWESYKFGADLHRAGEPLERCLNAEQRRGWWDSVKAQAVATLPANSADRLGF